MEDEAQELKMKLAAKMNEGHAKKPEECLPDASTKSDLFLHRLHAGTTPF
jgi:hypothetical protein